MRTPGRHVQSNSELRYISKFASPTSPVMPYRTQVMHLAGNGNNTYCGRKLADPYTVYARSGHRLCDQCASVRASQ